MERAALEEVYSERWEAPREPRTEEVVMRCPPEGRLRSGGRKRDVRW